MSFVNLEIRGRGLSLTNSHKKAAFTLAEVLITLAIIGVVAAMTIPTLVANYQNKAWSTSAQVFERKLEEALKTMNTQQTLAGYRNTADFVAELGKHFKITKVCQNDDLMSCFDETINWQVIDLISGTADEAVNMENIKTAADLGQDDWNTDVAGVQFANGVTGLLAYNPDCKQDPYSNQITGSSCISIIYDTNGFKTPNTYSKDIRAINAKLNGKCAFKSGSTCFSAPFYPTPLTLAECQEEVAKGELGISECFYNTDYWAGAVKACGGVSKMPTQTQLKDIANYVYNTSVTLSGITSGLTRDYDKVAELGFTASSGSSFYVMTGEEAGGLAAYNRTFGPTYTGRGNSGVRGRSDHQAVCLGD